MIACNKNHLKIVFLMMNIVSSAQNSTTGQGRLSPIGNDDYCTLSEGRANHARILRQNFGLEIPDGVLRKTSRPLLRPVSL